MGNEQRPQDDFRNELDTDGQQVHIGSAPLSLFCSGYTGQSRDLPDGHVIARVEGGRPDMGYIRITYTLRLTPQDPDGPYHVEEEVKTSDPGSLDTWNVLDFRRRPYDHAQQAILRSRYKLMLEMWTSEVCYYVSELPLAVSKAIEDDACQFSKVAHTMLHDTGRERRAKEQPAGGDSIETMVTDFFARLLGGKAMAEVVEPHPTRKGDKGKTDC